MQKKTTHTRNLIFGFGLSLFLLIISSVTSYISIQNLLQSSGLVNHTNVIIRELETVISTMKDAETGQRGYLLTNKVEFLEPYYGASSKVANLLKTIKQLTADNPTQQVSCNQLKNLTEKRLNLLKELIDLKKSNATPSLSNFNEGRIYMDEVRQMVKIMQNREEQLLRIRTAAMSKYASYTPILIIIAAILSILITIFFFVRVTNDFEEKNKLQKDLERKDEEIQNRINIIEGLANKISNGDYTIRINDNEKDGLGSLSFALDKMAQSLAYSFGLLSDEEWLQTGIAKLNETMVGEKDLPILTYDIIEFISTYIHCQVGALYLLEGDFLHLQKGYSLVHNKDRDKIKIGEGLVGQCALSGKQVVLNNIEEESISISFATGEAKPKSIITFPFYHDNTIKGVIELASLNEFSSNDLAFLKNISSNIGISITSAQNRKKLQELLEETQVQSEELQSQHSELQGLNTELESQAQKLQASEEELRVQQEELLQTNIEVEERSRLLEEKNQVIVERNLDILQKAEQLELSTKYKSEFLANMSHELRTPLNSILLLSRLISEDKQLSKELIEYAEVIESSGNGLLSLIDEILDLSKIESGKMTLEYESVPIEDIITDMRSLFGLIAKEKKLELKINKETGLLSILQTDKMRLEQILKNLISNALKFTSQGSIILDISQPARGKFIHFLVKDTGIGIAPDKQQLIFEAFQQEDGSTKRKFGGTGLGLSISRELAKLLQGEIQLKSTQGKGSEFLLIIPISQSVAAAIPTPPIIQNNEPEEPVKKVAIKNTESFVVSVIPDEILDDRDNLAEGDQTILIIEDDTRFAKALLDFAHKKKYKGIIAVRGDQGIEMALIYNPFAIMLDIQLPVMDGWQVMDELKANPKTRHIPVHIMSSMAVKRESLMKGAVDFIDKPVALEQMQDIFKKLEDALSKGPKKVLIIEENSKHAKALSYFLSTSNINSEITENVNDSIHLLHKKEVDCVILDMGVLGKEAYSTLDIVKKSKGLENLPIIVFTGKSLSVSEENRIKQYADSIVVKTAHSYQRILDEASIFLHLVEKNKKQNIKITGLEKLVKLREVLKNKTVLIADDDVRNIFSITKALEQHNMKVISATDGQEAIKQLNKNPQVDIVLMDMMMPEMDGYDSTTKIRQNSAYKNLPILAVTAKAMMGDREKCISAGASDYISKPIDIDQLISLLRVWLYDKYM